MNVIIRFLNRFFYRFVVTVIMIFCCTQSSSIQAADVVIRIVGNGSRAVYLGPGQTVPEPTKVVLGDVIIWKNEGNTDHTATSYDDSGVLLFNTDSIPAGKDSSRVTITPDIFTRAGGKTGGTASLNYFCDFHGGMEGKLEIRESSTQTRSLAVAAGMNVRRDITSLSTAELAAYRDAWRKMETSGAFQVVAGYHGCPRQLCHGDESIFFLWHREYLLRLETALGSSVHYWDWTTPSASSTGIPSVFTDSSYISPIDGKVYPNPLQSTIVSCPTGTIPRSTRRSPRNPLLLAQYAQDVRNAMMQSDFQSFSDAINFGPHGQVHVWVNGDMGSTTLAAYDPIFWAHHSNVDRLWTSWQASGNPDPTADILVKPLPGFAPKIGRDVLKVSDLGYSYDRLGTAPITSILNQVAMTRSASTGDGIGKTFSVSARPSAVAIASAVPASAKSLQLLVGGADAHSKRSLFVYVFANQSNATIEDANPNNPKFVGTFAVFGGSGKPDRHDNTKDRPVMTLPPGFDERIGQPVTELTLVVVDENDVIVNKEDIPFDSAKLVAIEPRPQLGQQVNTDGWKSFEGTSNGESFDEAYQNAVNAAQNELNLGQVDRLIETRVEEIKGTRGGIAGSTILIVRISARLR